MKNIICVLIYFISTTLIGQENKSCIKINDSLTGKWAYKFSKIKPEPIDGNDNLTKELLRNIKIQNNEYEKGIFDKELIAGFIIDTHGNVIGERMISTSGSKRIDEKFLEILSKSKWKSGFCEKIAVNSWINYSLMIYSTE